MDDPTAPFPLVERVVYGRNPLHMVVCQVRYPPLLRLRAQVPFELQEAIQDRFPVYGEAQPDLDVPPQLAELLPTPSRTPAHRFQSEDGVWALSLEPNFVALTCASYRSWDEFSRILFDVLSKFTELYKPSFFNRIGLRYQNLIRREWVDESIGWEELIDPSLVGPIANRDLESRLSGASASLRIAIGSNGDTLHFKHGLAEVEGEPQRCYLLDFDYFNDSRIETKDAEHVISRLYRYSGPAFQWAITSTLHAAMDPQS